MYQIENLKGNSNISIIAEKGPFMIIEYAQDLSVSPEMAMNAYFAAKMNIRKRQLMCNVRQSGGIRTQARAMQYCVGNVRSTTGVKGVGDFFGKAMRSTVTKETAIKPEYVGQGTLVLEPTYKYLILIDVAQWGGSIVVDDGLFLACETSLQHKLVSRTNLSSALAGGEGLFNLSLNGNGILCIEADCPKEELIEIVLDNDELKIDGNYAIAWSKSLEFTVERAGKTLLGSAMSGEALVNVYRGSGRVLMMPVRNVPWENSPTPSNQ